MSQPGDDQLTSEFSTGSASGLEALAQRFELLGELGRGGMGVVYRARDLETNETIAVKVLKPEIAHRADLMERFKTELRLARKITHKNVCRVYDLHRFGDTAAIAMEYVEGESLRAVLGSTGGVALRRGLDWSGQICRALAEAHAQDIVHRDLKPENILIDRAGQAKVMDFGIARSIESAATMATSSGVGVILGTPAYMSPEQAEGKPADSRSDIYSLGLILYEMFTGRQALQAETPVALAHKQIHETPPPPRGTEPLLPNFLDRAIQKCLEKKPEKRFQTATELETALAEKGEAKLGAVREAEVELPVRLTRWQRSDWALVAAALAGLALFFPFFNRTSIAPRSQVTFDRGELRRICEEYAQRLGAPVTGSPSMQLLWWGEQHDYVARHSGAQAALELTGNPVPYWLWRMDWPNGTEVEVDHHGALLDFVRRFPRAPAIERAAPEAAKGLAEKDIREFFGGDPSLLTLEVNTEVRPWGQPATEFVWVDPRDYSGLKHLYRVQVSGSQTGRLTEVYYQPGPDINFLNEEGWHFVPGTVLVVVLLILGISQRRKVAMGARWHIAFIALGSLIGIWFGELLGTSAGDVQQRLTAVFTGVATAFVAYFLLVTLERAVRRVWPHKLTSLARAFDRRVISEPCGLAILRGTLLGLALLGLDFFLVWLGTAHLGMRLDSTVLAYEPPRSSMIGTGWSVAGVTVKEFYQAGAVAIILSLVASFFARLMRRRWLVLGLAALLAAIFSVSPVFNMGAVQPYAGKLAILFIECLLLTFALSRFDVLTLLWAAFTFAFCWANYYLLVMFEPTGAFEEWTAFVVFGLLVLAAAGVAFQTSLRAGYRRAKLAFE